MNIFTCLENTLLPMWLSTKSISTTVFRFFVYIFFDPRENYCIVCSIHKKTMVLYVNYLRITFAYFDFLVDYFFNRRRHFLRSVDPHIWNRSKIRAKLHPYSLRSENGKQNHHFITITHLGIALLRDPRTKTYTRSSKEIHLA